MEPSVFDSLEQASLCNGPESVFALLVAAARREKNYQMLFGARVMEVRQRLGLPLIDTDPEPKLTADQRPIYQAALAEAARETGSFLLDAGDICGAWPYFKAIGDPGPIAAAVENVEEEENLDRIIEIAYREGVHRQKGFELILKHHGICSAITWFESNPDPESRQLCLALLVRTLHRDVVSALRETIATTEASAPPDDNIDKLIAGRSWLFEGTSSYVDSTHLTAVVRFSPELEDPEVLKLAKELADYGQHLNPMFHFRGDPPFESTYLDHSVYLRALLNEEVDAAIAHFTQKVVDGGDIMHCEALVDLLCRLGRYRDAVQASLDYLPGPSNPMRNCPPVLQLCQMAGDYTRLRNLARESDDLLGFAAGVLQEQEKGKKS